MNCSEKIVRYLSAAGIERVYGYPGDPSVPFLEACRRENMEFVLATREGTAGFMAEAYGQITGRPGVCLSTLGPGSSSMVNAVATAHLDRVPMIAISGQIDTARLPYFTHQVLDHTQLFAPITKWTASIAPKSLDTIMRKALRTAVAERPGPVHLSTPADLVGADAGEGEVQLPPLAAAQEMVAAFAVEGAPDLNAAMRAARRPIILVGMAALRAPGAGAAITRLAERLGCPVVSSPMAKGVFDETHPLFAGTLDMACNGLMWDFMNSADRIINIGFDGVELIKPWSPQAPVLHIDATPNTDQIYLADIELVGPIAQVIEGLVDTLPGSATWSEAEIAAHRKALRAAYQDGRVAGRLNPSDLVDVVGAALPDACITSDVGSHKLLVGQGWVARSARSVLMTNGLSSMGYSLPAAIAAKQILPERDVVCFTGDGGFAMVQGELRLAATLKAGVVVVVFCDNSLNRIELKQQARQLPSFGTRIEATDVPRAAESMGCEGVRVDTIAELEKVLANRRGDATVPLVIAAHIDPAQYAAQF
ncbi:thiamine pyrophosphate-binding protein [Alkalilacustris brevis]|uniref:thiamine pyrophosphate-binding protein n=1 Tax=Alkalilacustris brevis TaxID=2026338 RepID=UPI000E0DA2AB|nr:thiamine pyrophosphate-binding protein [Alkalilacustris brevis]